MRKVINIISAILSVIMIGVTLAVGWYQTLQIVDFLPGSYGLENDKWCKVDTSNLCTIWPDRFSMIAFGVIVPIAFGPFVLVFLNTMANPLPLKKRLLTWFSIMIVSILVYLSGIILYAVL
jgi:hypothetical protein